MADIPSISITNEFSDNDDDTTDNQIDNNVATDCENLDSDSDCGRVTTGNNLFAYSKKTHKTKKDALTDCEDFDGSDSDDSPLQAEEDNDGITLEQFLDQGFCNETTRFNGQNEATYDGPRRPTRCVSPMPKNCLNIVEDVGGLTDYEDLDASADDDDKSEDEEIELPLLMDENNTVESHDNVRSAMGKHHMSTTDSSESTASSGDEHTPCKLKQKLKNLRAAASDTENLVFSDYESYLKTCPKNAVENDLVEDEIIILEVSDVEEGGPSEVDSTRCGGVKCRNIAKETHKPGTPQFSKLLAVLQDPNEGVTDVENLDSSDEDDDTAHGVAIPPAIVHPDFLTDVEDLGDVESEPEDEGVEGDGFNLPKPVRQLITVQETNTGAPVSRVVPLSDNLSLAATVGYQDKGLTDTEDLSDVNEDLYDISEYLIDCVPDMEAGKISGSEKLSSSQLGLPRNSDEPVTDTEDLADVKDTRKKRHRHRHSNRHKQRLQVNNDDDEGTTDVEELILSEQGSRRYSSYTTQASAGPLLTIAKADDGGHTDVEVLSGDEDEVPQRGRRMQRYSSPNILNKSDWFNSAEATKESLGEKGSIKMHSLNMNLPRLRKLSPTPDLGQTDDEEMSRSGEEDDDDAELKRNVTPAAVHRQLDENSCTTHDQNSSMFDAPSEQLNVRGHQDIQEALTDTECLEDDVRN